MLAQRTTGGVLVNGVLSQMMNGVENNGEDGRLFADRIGGERAFLIDTRRVVGRGRAGGGGL